MKVIFKQMKHDYPKQAGDLNLAWYAGGRICIVRKKTKRALQKQNLSIIQINAISKSVWETLLPKFKRDLAKYAMQYKREYPVLRKRGVSAYSVFLILIHALIKRFSLNTEKMVYCVNALSKLLSNLSIYQAIRSKLLKRLRACYQLNKVNGDESISLQIPLYATNNDLQTEKMISTLALAEYG